MTVELSRRYEGAETASQIARALAADNPARVEAQVDGDRLVLRVESPSAASARATLEDLLACVQAAERTVGAAKAR